MARLHLSPVSLHDEPNRDYVLTMNVVSSASVGVACARYTTLGWWSVAIAVCMLVALEVALRFRATAWLSIAVGTLASAAAGAIGALALAIGTTDIRAVWWAAGILGAIVGALLMLSAHRKLRGQQRAGTES